MMGAKPLPHGHVRREALRRRGMVQAASKVGTNIVGLLNLVKRARPWWRWGERSPVCDVRWRRFAKDAGRVAGDDSTGWHILGDNGASSDARTTADRHSTDHNRVRADPDLVFDDGVSRAPLAFTTNVVFASEGYTVE